jgi:hypothetical protein
LVGPRDCDGGLSPHFWCCIRDNRPKGVWYLTKPRVRIAFQQQQQTGPGFVPSMCRTLWPGSESKSDTKDRRVSPRRWPDETGFSKLWRQTRGDPSFQAVVLPLCLNAASRAVGGSASHLPNTVRASNRDPSRTEFALWRRPAAGSLGRVSQAIARLGHLCAPQSHCVAQCDQMFEC